MIHLHRREVVMTAAKSVPFNAWIDDLVEFQETILPATVTTNLTIAEAPLKLEANKDIPSITILDFDADFMDHTQISWTTSKSTSMTRHILLMMHE